MRCKHAREDRLLNKVVVGKSGIIRGSSAALQLKFVHDPSALKESCVVLHDVGSAPTVLLYTVAEKSCAMCTKFQKKNTNLQKEFNLRGRVHF